MPDSFVSFSCTLNRLVHLSTQNQIVGRCYIKSLGAFPSLLVRMSAPKSHLGKRIVCWIGNLSQSGTLSLIPASVIEDGATVPSEFITWSLKNNVFLYEVKQSQVTDFPGSNYGPQ